MLGCMLCLAAALCITLAAAAHSERHNASLYWGSYRPNLYFGLRTRSPESPLVGLIWHGMDPATQPWDSNVFDTIQS